MLSKKKKSRTPPAHHCSIQQVAYAPRPCCASLEGITLGLAGGGSRGGGAGDGGGGGSAGLSLRYLACLHALITVVLFLAGTLGPSWFAVLEPPQNAEYVPTTGGITPPAPAALRAASGRPVECGSM
jgi:hypothetical protein